MTDTLTAKAATAVRARCEAPDCESHSSYLGGKYCKRHKPRIWREQPGRPHRAWYAGGGKGTPEAPLQPLTVAVR